MKNEPKAPARFRVEEDALGNVDVPVEHLWGA
jgi:fumarate hydratase class II